MTLRERKFIRWSVAVLIGLAGAVTYGIYGRECDHWGVVITNESGQHIDDARLMILDDEVWRGAIAAGETRRPAITGIQEADMRLVVDPGGRSASISYALAGVGARHFFVVHQDTIDAEVWRGASSESGWLAPAHQLEWMFTALADLLACGDHDARALATPTSASAVGWHMVLSNDGSTVDVSDATAIGLTDAD